MSALSEKAQRLHAAVREASQDQPSSRKINNFAQYNAVLRSRTRQSRPFLAGAGVRRLPLGSKVKSHSMKFLFELKNFMDNFRIIFCMNRNFKNTGYCKLQSHDVF